MDAESIANALPELYRDLLDRIAELERSGARREADLIRAAAIAAYSGPWDARTRRRLEHLGLRARRVIHGEVAAREQTVRPSLQLGRLRRTAA